MLKTYRGTMPNDPFSTGRQRAGASSPLRAHPGYAGFVISTLAQETSRWLKEDLPERLQTKYGLPVHHVSAPADFFGTTSDSWKTGSYFFGSGMP